MSDDLSKLTPNDPSNLDPGWSGARKDILDGVLTEPSQRRRGVGRWVAGAAAAALIVVAIGGVVQQLRPEPYAAPASPSASVSPIPSGQLVAANDTLIDSGDGIGLCNGIVQQSRPPQCEDVTPVAGITWDDLDWASSYNGTSWAPAVLVGTFDGTTFSATRVYSPYDPEAPARPATDHEDAEFEPLCSDPVQGYGTASSEDALGSIAEDLPGFQSMWPSNDSGFYNIAVTKDVARAREILQESWSKPFCVGTLNGPTHTSMEAANEALREFTKGGGHLPFLVPPSRIGPTVSTSPHCWPPPSWCPSLNRSWDPRCGPSPKCSRSTTPSC